MVKRSLERRLSGGRRRSRPPEPERKAERAKTRWRSSACLGIVEPRWSDLQHGLSTSSIVPARSPGAAQAELNAFLTQPSGADRGPPLGGAWAKTRTGLSAWTTWSRAGRGAGQQARTVGAKKIDYRERLSAEDFASLRQAPAARQGDRPGGVCPGLHGVHQRTTGPDGPVPGDDQGAMEQIAGVGDARIEKYGPRLLDLLEQQWDGG